MKILMQIRNNVFSCPGGDTVQMQKTKQELEALGYDVDLSLELRPNLESYDLVHLFNLTRVQETYIQVQNAVEQNKPIVFSTIYWPNAEFEKKANVGVRKLLGKALNVDQMESLKAAAKFFLLGNHDDGTRHLMTHSYQRMQRYILEHTDIFLPNAMEEMNQIEKVLGFHARREQTVVVPNAIDLESAQAAMRQPVCDEFEKYRDWLICVGRIDTRKNQLALLQAIKGSPYRLLLVGKCSPGQKPYFHKVMKAIAGNPSIQYLEHIENSKLYQLYKVCRVSVLPSWFETPGLVSLEAAAMGCNIVVSDKGTTKDYFGKYAYYCNVMDSVSIRKQIDRAYETPFDEAFREKIFSEYTWKKAAEKTAEGYRQALALRG